MFVQLLGEFCFPKSRVATVAHMLAVDPGDIRASIHAKIEIRAQRYVLRQVGGLGEVREVGLQQVVQVA